MSARPYFATQLAARWVSEKGRRLVAPLVFYSAKFNRTFTVPEGFETDFASVPRLPFIYWLFGGVADEAATLHDYLYTGVVSRKDADAIFREAIAVCGTQGWRGTAMWLGVRIGGGSHYTPPVPGAAPDAVDQTELSDAASG